ncbi:MAG: Tetratricopeptide repeat protein [Candidatus Acidoferrum typicum]|nr:Tetratricopeptide repeat protein [Candidatus Acidoferrum typicum]
MGGRENGYEFATVRFRPLRPGQWKEHLKMAYNKSKHIDAAQKYLQQGKMPQAIAEYQHILKNEPKDQVTLMTLGDLFVRQGETFQALEYFERLAKIFLNDGFTTKAIAIYKKVAKLAPEETRPLERLAELYVQQGVLSEARPLYLQLAEVHLKGGRQQQAAALLRKLLEAEPDNQRVHTRLGELQLAMGQPKEALETFHNAAQRLLDHGDHAEAIRLADRVLGEDAKHQPTLSLKARALIGAGKRAEACTLLESFADRNAGGETTAMLLKQYMESGQPEKAAGLAENLFEKEPKNYLQVHEVASILVEKGDHDRAQVLLALIRNTMIDSGEHEALAQTFSRLAEGQPGRIEPLEWLVDLYGRASDSFRLPDALAQLAHALEAAGETTRALETYEQLVARSPEDETTRRKYTNLRAKAGLEPVSEISRPVKLEAPEPGPQVIPPAPVESDLDEETQRYVTQALTDVDLFSSYGLTQKAIDLLESVLERAPRHTPVLERLLDFSVGAANDSRTSELATTLEQIALERKDRAAAERYAEFRRRFQRATEQAPVAPSASSPSPATAPPEFAVPTIEAQLDEPVVEAPGKPEPVEQSVPRAPVRSVVHEVDLSDEWAALSQQLSDSSEAGSEAPSDEAAETHSETAAPAPEVAPEEAVKEVHAQAPDFDLELQSPAPTGSSQEETETADALFADLAMELESATSSLGIPKGKPQQAPPRPASPPAGETAPPQQRTPVNGATVPVAASGGGASGPLGDLFEEFRSEMGEPGKGEHEDLETHYNLGIAYREMGLLEEAISEFQKVAKSEDKGPAFRYAMQCCTLLGLAFMEKGQPAIAAIWYERALQTPGLDQESILALRYDLGVAQELAGDKAAAVKSFSQVYAMNIDYRDVSERISQLEKAR